MKLEILLAGEGALLDWHCSLLFFVCLSTIRSDFRLIRVLERLTKAIIVYLAGETWASFQKVV
jgi:hypothetical protein